MVEATFARQLEEHLAPMLFIGCTEQSEQIIHRQHCFSPVNRNNANTKMFSVVKCGSLIQTGKKVGRPGFAGFIAVVIREICGKCLAGLPTRLKTRRHGQCPNLLCGNGPQFWQQRRRGVCGMALGCDKLKSNINIAEIEFISE
ncbi:hypothetical protein [Massilia sp. TS11]|uniref:hypothetical protein n=1 Tax=Massilia sp. TS11 TaxID=2908003 RepID=UPI001EDB0960|nr:hypothetical protein [Massilia sp. TS11]MCG2584145.1 hypothetical protein [Massilia sp. TS11]